MPCSAESITERIIADVEGHCSAARTCMSAISMKSLTPFVWDRLAIFKVGSSNAEVSSALGIAYPDATDLMAGLVFANDGSIVHRERFPYYPEKPDRLSFDLKGHVTAQAFSPGDARFKVEKEIIDGKSYYFMRPAE